MTKKIEVFYTGGGITLAEADVDADHYAVVSTEAPEFLSIYSLDDGEKTYLLDDMVASTHRDELPPDLKILYSEMLSKLEAVA